MKRQLKRICQTLFFATAMASAISHAEEPAVSDEARAHFSAGLNYIDDPEGPKYEEAYREFKAAYAASPNWKILGNLGTCAFYLERDGEAIEAYKKYLAEGGNKIPKDERTQIEKDLATLKTSLVSVSLTLEPDNASADDERVPSQGAHVLNRYTDLGASTTLGVHPGHHRMTVSAPQRVSEVWEFDAEPGATLSKSFTLKPEGGANEAAVEPEQPSAPLKRPVTEPPPVEEHGTPALVYVGLAATGALAAGATATGLVALSKHSRYDQLNDERRYDEANDAKSTGQTLNIVTDFLIGAAVVAAGGTAYLYFDRKKGPPADQSAASVRLSPQVGPSGAWMRVNGTF